ncbi:MAG: peroxide stress protein YaaA [Pararhodobacter sp.]|nr:peroxide stress protein YaaA [Pararhodobacter sp.]
MLVIISPAKKLDWRPVDRPMDAPRFQEAAAQLAGFARQLPAAELGRLMHLSVALSALNHERFQRFASEPAPEVLRPAALGFAGDTYVGLHAASLDSEAREWARGHLRILSGIYGLLRPEDGIQEHRLEMGTKLATPRGKSLYDWWGPRIARALNADAQAVGAGAVVNCASKEYFAAVDTDTLALPVITPVFLDRNDGEEARIVSFHAKRARGAMARFVMENRLSDPADLRHFDAMGYRFQPGKSCVAAPVFLREHPPR